MQSENELAAIALCDALSNSGYAVSRNGSACTLEGAQLVVTVIDVGHHERNADIVFVSYRTRHADAKEMHFDVVCTGAAPGFEHAARHAAEQWVDLAFPVFHSVYGGHEPSSGVTLGKLTTVIQATSKAFGWQIHMGPIFTRAFGDPYGVPKPESDELLRYIVDAVAGVSAHNFMFSTDLYVARSSDGDVTADCRFNNEPWPEANEEIVEAVSDWPAFKADMVSKRQLLVFVPVPAESRVAQEILREASSPKPPLWKRLLGRN